MIERGKKYNINLNIDGYIFIFMYDTVIIKNKILSRIFFSPSIRYRYRSFLVPNFLLERSVSLEYRRTIPIPKHSDSFWYSSHGAKQAVESQCCPLYNRCAAAFYRSVTPSTDKQSRSIGAYQAVHFRRTSFRFLSTLCLT